MHLPTPGEVFEEKYEIQQVIGKGGFATVFRATDIDVGRDVALKILSPRDGGYPEAVVARFLREARLLAGLQDPHTITMFDFGRTDDGLLFMVFEYVSGVDLAEVLKRREKLPPDEVKHILKQVLYALREAHDAGIFHRDIKPPNLLIYEYMGDPSCVKLLDFGVAKPVESHPLGPANLTKKGAMVGTPRYMAPEQIFGRELTPAADIYSLGLVAYEMLTGRPVMDAKTNKDRVRQQLSDDQERVPKDVGTAALRSVIDRMILKDPDARYQSAGDALVAVRSGKVEPRQRKPAPPRPAARPEKITPSRSATIDENAAPAPLGPNLARVLFIGLVTAGSGVAVLAMRAACSDPPAEVVQLGGPETPHDIEPPAVPVAKAAAAKTSRGDAPPGRPSATAEEPSKAGRGSAGCGRAPQDIGLNSRQTMIGLRSRDWAQYVPAGYDPDHRHPIVLLFHQMFSNPRAMIDYTKMDELADRHGLVLIAIQSESATAKWKDIDNYELVTSAMDETRQELCVDESKVFAIGHGRGGWFARDLGCYMPLSAIAITGGGQHVGEAVCRPVPPVPMIRLYGNADPLVPPGGGAGCVAGDYLSADEINRGWIERYRCDEEPTVWLEHDNGVCRTWACEMERATFVSCELEGGHDWPGTPPVPTAPGCESLPAKFPYRDTIWRFFEHEGRPL